MKGALQGASRGGGVRQAYWSWEPRFDRLDNSLKSAPCGTFEIGTLWNVWFSAFGLPRKQKVIGGSNRTGDSGACHA